MLTVGVHGLSPAESGAIRGLLLLTAGDRRWSFAPSGLCDVLLAPAEAPDAREATLSRGARALLFLGGDGADTLPRPLQADALEARLRQVTDRLPADPAPAAARVSPQVAATRRYKLLRWPPAEFLRGETQRTRMASQLSRRFLSAEELARLTQLDVARCLVFLQLLQGFRLLEAEPATAAPPTATAAPRAPRPEGGWGLVQSIRRRLGF